MKRFWKAATAVAERRRLGRRARRPAAANACASTAGRADRGTGAKRSPANGMRAEDDVDPRAMPLTGSPMPRSTGSRPDRGHSPRASPNMPRPTSPATAPRGRRAWSSGRPSTGTRCSAGRGGASTSISATTSGLIHVDAAAGDGRAAGACGGGARSVPACGPVAAGDDRRIAGRGAGVLEGALTPEQAWEAVSVDERWQLEQWGSDAEAEAALDNRRRDFLAAAQLPGAARRA